MNEPAPQDPEDLPFSIQLRRYLRQLSFRIVIYLDIYLVIAILTIGPCFWYWHEATYANGQRWIAKFYAPLVWLSDHCSPLRWLINQYVDWWIL